MNLHNIFVLAEILVFSWLVGGQKYMNDFHRLTHVPRQIPDHTKMIYLNNNEISKIESRAFYQYSECTNLRLNWNRLTEVRKDMWTGLTSLKYLSLEHNYIEVIEPSAFADLPNLKGLYLHNNKLKSLPDNIFSPKQMPRLEILTLHDNSLKWDDLGWLRELCDSKQIQQYTIRGDDVTCDQKRTKNHERRDFKTITPQLAPTRQDKAISHTEATAADSTIDLETWLIIIAGGAIILTAAGVILLLRTRAPTKAGKKAKRIYQFQDNCHKLLTSQGASEFRVFMDHASESSSKLHGASTQTNQSFHTTCGGGDSKSARSSDGYHDPV